MEKEKKEKRILNPRKSALGLNSLYLNREIEWMLTKGQYVQVSICDFWLMCVQIYNWNNTQTSNDKHLHLWATAAWKDQTSTSM